MDVQKQAYKPSGEPGGMATILAYGAPCGNSCEKSRPPLGVYVLKILVVLFIDPCHSYTIARGGSIYVRVANTKTGLAG